MLTDDLDDDRDYWQEYKDGVAMGYIDRDGNQLDPPEPDFADLERNELDDYGPTPEPPAEDPWGDT